MCIRDRYKLTQDLHFFNHYLGQLQESSQTRPSAIMKGNPVKAVTAEIEVQTELMDLQTRYLTEREYQEGWWSFNSMRMGSLMNQPSMMYMHHHGSSNQGLLGEVKQQFQAGEEEPLIKQEEI